ncbi:MAG: hypothetical protein INR72_10315, partial [Williamsia herbipolensis]|nr:hypothetical protein [Williamsia herbipolensis]
MPEQKPHAAFRRRRRRDLLIAAAGLVVVVIAAGTVYLTSDIRAVNSQTAPQTALPGIVSSAPRSLRQVWSQPSDAAAGSTASARGIVVTTDEHTVIGRDPETGAQRWVYGRSNRNLCAVASTDLDRDDTNGVSGIIAVYRHGDLCQEVVTLDPRTGERLYQRTTPGAVDGELVTGGPYAGWLGPDLLDLWRSQLVRTYEYGNQSASPEANSGHTGCTFLDAAVTNQQFATIERCPQQGSTLRLNLNWADPHDHDDKYSSWSSKPRAEFDTGATAARIVGITQDRVAVLVNAPATALVVYDADGSVVSRTATAVPDDVFGVDGPTPRVTLDDV